MIISCIAFYVFLGWSHDTTGRIHFPPLFPAMRDPALGRDNVQDDQVVWLFGVVLGIMMYEVLGKGQLGGRVCDIAAG